MFKLTDSQEVDLTVVFDDKKGNVAAVDGVPVWSSSDETIVKVVNPSADGLTAVAQAVGPIGQATITVTGDADLGSGVASVVGTFDIQVGAGQAVTPTVTAGAPREQA